MDDDEEGIGLPRMSFLKTNQIMVTMRTMTATA